MIKRLSNPRVVVITARLAQAWAAMPSIAADRPLSKMRMANHQAQLDAGMIRTVDWVSAKVKETGEVLRLNGKHTSTLFSLTDLALLPPLYANIEEWECDTLAEAAAIYGTIDPAISSRSTRDNNKVTAAADPELAVLSMKNINAIAGGLGWAGNPEMPSVGHSSAKTERLITFKNEVLWVDSLLSPEGKIVDPKLLRRAAVIGAMIRTWRLDSSDATEFWTAVRDETGATPTKPDRQLARFLLRTSVMSQGVGSRLVREAQGTSREFYARSIGYWNSWCRNDETKYPYRVSARLPTPIRRQGR